MKREVKKYLEIKNGNTTYQILRDVEKAVLWREFIAINAYIKKQERSQVNNLSLHLKELETEEKTKTKVSRKKEINRMEINKIETKKRKDKWN